MHEHVSCEMLVTGACNLDCSYCIARGIPRRAMTPETASRAIDLFIELATGASSAEFTFSGGEPLLNFPIVRACTQYARERCASAGISPSFVIKTNGTKLTAEQVEFFEIENVTVVVSLDGERHTHDRHRRDLSGGSTHAQIERNVAALLGKRIPCVASLTVHPDECDGVVAGARYLHQLGIERINIGPVYGTVVWRRAQISRFLGALGEVALYLKQVNGAEPVLEVEPLNRFSEHVDGALADSWGCGASTTNLAFLPDGTIAGCSALAMLAHDHSELILGNVQDGINDAAVERLQGAAQAPLDRRPPCQQCPGARDCTGGCLAINLATTKRELDPPELYCETICSLPSLWKSAWGGLRSGHA